MHYCKRNHKIALTCQSKDRLARHITQWSNTKQNKEYGWSTKSNIMVEV